MNRGHSLSAPLFIALFVILFLGVGFLLFGPQLMNQGQGRILLLSIIDTCRWDSLSCYGSPRETTPSIDELAAEGVRFELAFSDSSWTLPSIASILTSTHPSLHGGLGKGLALHKIRSSIATGAEALKKEGFSTHAVVNCAFLSPALGLNRGFSEYDYNGAYNNQVRRADRTVDAAIEYLKRHEGEDVFLVVHFFDPHLNYDPLPPYKGKFTNGYDGSLGFIRQPLLDAMMTGRTVPEKMEQEIIRGLYDGEIAFVDRHFGRLLDWLKTSGAYETAAIVLTADHGEEFWDHGKFEHGHSLYDEQIHVPLIIKPPKTLQPVRNIVKSQVRLIDILPTLFEIAGVPSPETFQGESLLPHMTLPKEPEDRIAFSEGPLYGSNRLSLRKGEFKYIFDPAGKEESLFRWKRDPGERDNMLLSLPEKAAELREEVLRLHRSLLNTAQTMPPAEQVDMTDDLLSRLRSLGYIK